MRRLKFDEAVQETIKDRTLIGNFFQKMIVICAISGIMTGFVILGGISFLEKVPNRFECKSDSLDVIKIRSSNMTHESASNPQMEPIKSTGTWKQCS